MKEYAGELGNIVAVDGKAIRSTAQKGKSHSAMQILTAYCVESGVVLGQAAIPENKKTNEIPVFQELLDNINITSKTVTADAMHCQKETSIKIIKKNGDYVFGLKGNQGNLFEEVKLYFDDLINKADIQTYAEPKEKNGGRIESRKIAVCYDPVWLSMINEWQGLASVIAVTRKITDKYKTTVETEYYISSLSAPPKFLLETIRHHWGVESMHWLLDVVFDEDETRFIDENANQSLNILRKLALMFHRNYIKGLNKKTKPTTKVNMLQCLLRSEMIVTILS
jgi:predicted transposase YbfD/YdcC